MERDLDDEAGMQDLRCNMFGNDQTDVVKETLLGRGQGGGGGGQPKSWLHHRPNQDICMLPPIFSVFNGGQPVRFSITCFVSQLSFSVMLQRCQTANPAGISTVVLAAFYVFLTTFDIDHVF